MSCAKQEYLRTALENPIMQILKRPGRENGFKARATKERKAQESSTQDSDGADKQAWDSLSKAHGAFRKAIAELTKQCRLRARLQMTSALVGQLVDEGLR